MEPRRGAASGARDRPGRSLSRTVLPTRPAAGIGDLRTAVAPSHDHPSRGPRDRLPPARRGPIRAARTWSTAPPSPWLRVRTL